MKHIKTIGIIGGGLSGLSAGIVLARRGYRVRMFEANDTIGGCCGTTTIDGFTFNDGALYLALPSLLDAAFSRLGLDRTAQLPLRPITATQTTRLADGATVTIANGRVRIEGATEARNTQVNGDIDVLVRKWQPVFRFFADDVLTQPFSLTRLFVKGWRHLPKLRGTVADKLAVAIREPAVRATLSGLLLYTGLPPERIPLFQIIGVTSLFSEGFHLPEAGMGAIPALLREAFLTAGGHIQTDTRIERIGLSNGCAASLFAPEHGHFVVDAVLSTVSGMQTALMIDPAKLPPLMRLRADMAPLSQQAFCIQLGLANRIHAPSHSVSILPPMAQQAQFFEASEGELNWFNYTVPTVTLPELAPDGGSIVEMFAPIAPTMRPEDWTEEARLALADKAIRALSREHDLDIVTRRITSPKDYRDRMHLFDGAVYGLSPAADARYRFPHRTLIPRLFQAGQTTHPGYGVATSMLSGILAAEAVVKTVP